MPPDRILLIRHAEKPSDDGRIRGVDAFGREDAHALSVRGWQRAGALVRLFAPRHGAAPEMGLATPTALWAARATPAHPSRRSEQTLAPLAAWLSLPIHTEFAKGEEDALARAASAASGIVLVAWTHEGLPTIAHALGTVGAAPSAWPEECFDLVWVCTPAENRWLLRQTTQGLLAGDS
jgi:hypothetical protein